MSARILANEKLALGILLVLFLTMLAEPLLIQRYWMVAMLALAIIWLIAGLVVLASVAWAFNDEEEPVETLRAVVAGPLAFAAAILLGPTASWCSAFLYLHAHQAEIAAARRTAAAGAPVLLRYAEGIPDGGSVIIDLPDRRPEALPPGMIMRLTGQNIIGCRVLRGTTYLCAYS